MGVAWRNYLLDFRQKVLHGPGVLHQDGKRLLGGGRIPYCHHLVVEMRLVDDLSRMAHQPPDRAEGH